MSANISPLEAYALRRALAQMDIPADLPLTGWVNLLLHTLKPHNPEHWRLLSELVNADAELSRRVLEVDPKAAPPKLSRKDAAAPIIPALPTSAALSQEAIKAASSAGSWIDDCIGWLKTRASMSSALFLEAGALWAAAVLIAGRLRLNFNFESLKPHLYMLLVAPTTYYKKTTTLRAVEDLLRKVAPHLLIASQNSPELLLYKLAGNRSANFDQLSAYDQRIENAGVQFAAQRAIITDEATRLLSEKNYMAGLVENLLELFDARQQVERELRSDGKLIIRDSALSLFGATTPARLGMNIGQEQWHDGMLARFALITPTETHIPRSPATLVPDLDPPPELVQRLIELDRALPTPPYRDAAARLDDDGEPPAFPSLSVQITSEALEAYNRYADALHALCAPDRGLDERVKGNYGRLDKLAMKVAITLAALDWQPDQSSVPVIGIGHWARGQQTAERWRESLHRLLFDLSRSDDSQTEQMIVTLLARADAPLSRREIHLQLGSRNRKACYDSIEALLSDGMLTESERRVGRGPTTKVYQLAEE